MKKFIFIFNKPSTVSSLGILHGTHHNDSRSEIKARSFCLHSTFKSTFVVQKEKDKPGVLRVGNDT